MIKIKQLNGTSFDVIHQAFKDAFSDYVEPFDLTNEELLYMFERRGYDLELSFGAFDNDKLVGITINGIGDWNGKFTAYDTGTGVVKAYRKQGIATKMFMESLPVLKKAGIEQYLLEVIKSNVGAFELYKKAGFSVVREFGYFKSNKHDLLYKKIIPQRDYTFRLLEKPDWEILSKFWDFQPSWQNSVDSLKRKIDFLKILGVFKNSELIGYGIIEKHTGDIPQFAISDKHRRQGIGTALFRVLINYSEIGSIKIINSDANYPAFDNFIENIGIAAGDGQYEMIMEI